LSEGLGLALVASAEDLAHLGPATPAATPARGRRMWTDWRRLDGRGAGLTD